MERNNGRRSRGMVADMGCYWRYDPSVPAPFHLEERHWKAEKMNATCLGRGGVTGDYAMWVHLEWKTGQVPFALKNEMVHFHVIRQSFFPLMSMLNLDL